LGILHRHGFILKCFDTPIWLKQAPTGITLNLHYQPGAKQTKVVGLHDGCLKISLQAHALENKANELLLAWLSK